MSIISSVISKVTGLEGLASYTLVVVAWYGLFKVTCPVAVETIISPEASPYSSGNRIIRLLPVSSTVQVKSVPSTAILAVGVDSSTFFLLNAPLVNLIVPLANCSAILDLSGLGS